MFAALEAQRFEGMIGKRADSLYIPGQSKELTSPLKTTPI